MKREWVSSSSISSIGFDRSTNTLEVKFRNGRIYLYHLVPAHVYEELMAAESKGARFNELVRERYPTTEI